MTVTLHRDPFAAAPGPAVAALVFCGEDEEGAGGAGGGEGGGGGEEEMDHDGGGGGGKSKSKTAAVISLSHAGLAAPGDTIPGAGAESNADEGGLLRGHGTRAGGVDLVAAATATISALKLAGARVALDDFGAGRSSFSELCELPLDHVKIDKSLVERIAVDERAAGVVGAIVKMCEGLSLACVAEGVETAGQMDVLTRLGCEKAQGYLISRPLTEKAARAFVATHTAGLAPVRAAS